MKARIYRDPPLGILFVGKRRDGDYRIYRKSEVSGEVRQRIPGRFPFQETAQQALDTLARDTYLEELELI